VISRHRSVRLARRVGRAGSGHDRSSASWSHEASNAW
jgi:hypothetical protein